MLSPRCFWLAAWHRPRVLGPQHVSRSLVRVCTRTKTQGEVHTASWTWKTSPGVRNHSDRDYEPLLQLAECLRASQCRPSKYESSQHFLLGVGVGIK